MKFLGTLLISLIVLPIYASSGYFRSPDLHNDNYVFISEGDIWIANLHKKSAVRLTTSLEEEVSPKISPDGTLIAFSANYEGGREAYIIPIAGGNARRISFENSDVKIQGWTNNGEVLISTNNQLGSYFSWGLKLINPETLAVKELPLSDATAGVIELNSEYVYFIQFGIATTGDNAKRYRGGAMGELWRYKLNSAQEAELLTANHQGDVRSPMIDGQNVYFISDASGADNIWRMNKDGSKIKQLTFFEEWPIRNASINQQKILYQQGADLYLQTIEELQTIQARDEQQARQPKSSHKLAIKLISDFPYLNENWVTEPLNYLTSSHINQSADTVAIVARGQIAVASKDNTRLVTVATNPVSRNRNAVLSKNGQWVYALNDRSGESEIWRFPADGSSQPKQLTKDGKIFRWTLSLSPNNKWIAHDDQEGTLWLLNLKTGKNKKIHQGNSGLSPYMDISWSSDSRLLAFTQKHQKEARERVVLFELKTGTKQVLTSEKYQSFSPAFSPDNQWLYFLSNRHFAATPGHPWGDRNTGSIYDKRTQIFAFDIANRQSFPFKKPTELSSKDNKKQDKGDKEKSDKKQLSIVWKGLKDRLWQVPAEAGNYSKLSATSGFLFVKSLDNKKTHLKSIKINDKATTSDFAIDIEDYQIAQNAESLLVLQGKGQSTKFFIVPVGEKMPANTADNEVKFNQWQIALFPKNEWKQIFNDTWLMHRDQFFDRDMRHVDWLAMKKKYAPLVEKVTERRELNDLLAQMVGELNTLHSQVIGGDFKSNKQKPRPGLLGARLAATKKGVKIETIYKTDPELPDLASPLLKPGVNAQEGDLILSINGQPTLDLESVHRALRNQANKQVLLTLKRKKKQHKTVVLPISNDYRLRYQHWAYQNKAKISNDSIGYIHLHSMGVNDLAHFTKEFYAHYKKGGLIIDVRRNLGGNIDSMLLEKLLRQSWSFWGPTEGAPYTNMQQDFRGHLVVLADQFTYSDGETFAAGIKALDLAPVIGKRTAGAGVWLRDLNRQSDNGMARVAEFAQYAMDGRWIVEGYGVTPTIEVDNLPYETFNGTDRQLERAIKYLEEKIAQEPIPELKAKAFPARGLPADDILNTANGSNK